MVQNSMYKGAMGPAWTSGVPRGVAWKVAYYIKKEWVGFLDQIWTTAGQLSPTQD